jgi:subtilisin family serine protease
VPPNNFAAWDGTSMAAPHVTGLAALVLAHHPDFAGPFRARNAQRVQRLFQIIKASARPVNVGDPRRTGFGIPDAPTALSLQLWQQAGQAAFAPQGFFGEWPAQAAQPLGGAVGPLWGNPALGPQIGATGQLGRSLPWAAAPLWTASAQQPPGPANFGPSLPWTVLMSSLPALLAQRGYQQGWWGR